MSFMALRFFVTLALYFFLSAAVIFLVATLKRVYLGFRAVDQNVESPWNPVATKLGPCEPGFTKYHKTTPVASIVKTAMNPDILSFHPFISHRAIIPISIILIGLKREVFASMIRIPNPTIGTNHDGIGPFAEVIKEYG